MSMNGIVITALESMIESLKKHGIIGDPHGVQITKIERIEDELDEFDKETTFFRPQFMVWVWREEGVDSPNPCPQKMDLIQLTKFMIQCSSSTFAYNYEAVEQYVDDNFKEKTSKPNTLVGNVYEFNRNNWAVVDKVGDDYLVVPVDKKIGLVSEYDSSQHKYVYRMKHRILLPYSMFHKKTKIMIRNKKPINWIHQECIEEIMERIKKIESTNPTEYEETARKEYAVCGENEEYQELDKEWSDQKESLLSQVEHEKNHTGRWAIID